METTEHRIRYGGIGHGWSVVRDAAPGYAVVVSGPFTTREAAQREALRRETCADLGRCEHCGGPLEGWAGESHGLQCPTMPDSSPAAA